MACTVKKKAFCVLEFAKTESIATVQRRFRTMYRTEPPTEKTIYEWYMKFQQSGCLCAAKRRGRPGPSAETVERVRETYVRSPQKSPRVHISSTCKVGQKLGVSLPLLTCSPSAWPSRLLYRRGSEIPEVLTNNPVHLKVGHKDWTLKGVICEYQTHTVCYFVASACCSS